MCENSSRIYLSDELGRIRPELQSEIEGYDIASRKWSNGAIRCDRSGAGTSPVPHVDVEWLIYKVGDVCCCSDRRTKEEKRANEPLHGDQRRVQLRFHDCNPSP